MKGNYMVDKIMLSIGALLCGVAVIHGAENRIVIQPGPEGTDKYFGTVYYQAGINNDVLSAGGWGDYYYILIKFSDAANLMPSTFKRGELWFRCNNITRPTDLKCWTLTTPWSESPWDHANLMGYYMGVYPGPNTGNGKYGLNVTWSCTYWKSNPTRIYGFFFAPVANDNRFDPFFSSDATQADFRPELHIVYDVVDQTFGMPLPGGRAWKLTTEAGGKSYDGSTDQGHTGQTYYSLDFGRSSRPIYGGVITEEANVPVLAVAAGKVYDVSLSASNPNGYYVKIDHDGDGNPTTGFQTVYIHMKELPLVKKGDTVVRGQQLGIMGTTGVDSNGKPTSTGVHLHITFYYRGKAGPNGGDSPELNQLRMNGLLLKEYKLTTTLGSAATYGSPQFTPIFYP